LKGLDNRESTLTKVYISLAELAMYKKSPMGFWSQLFATQGLAVWQPRGIEANGKFR
jgi:hypothetical protein